MNNTNPLVSIIVPVYKIERYIHRSIDSLLRQTYNNLEIILVDDGSPDNCPFICDKYAMQDNRIRVIHKSNGGLSDARNAALNVMTGQYVTFVDSDDYIADNMIEKFIETVKLYQCNMVVAGMNIIDKNNQIYDYRRTLTSTLSTGIDITRKLLKDVFPFNFVCAKIFESSLFEEIRFPVGRHYEDTATTYKLTHKCERIYCIADCLYFYELEREGNITSELNTSKAIKSYIDGCLNSREQIFFCQKHKDFSDLLPVLTKRLQLWALLAIQSAISLGYKEYMFYYHQIRIYIRSLSYTQRMTHLQIALTFPIIYYSLYPLLSRLKKMYKN